MDVHVWHGQNRFSLHEALYPDEVERTDCSDEQEEIESQSDKDEDVVMVDEPGSDFGWDDDDKRKPKAMSEKVTKAKPKVEKKIQVVVTSYGVLVSEHARHEKSFQKSESSIFESSSTTPSVSRLLIVTTSRMASCCSG